ncbi:MAG: glycosyltransferase family 4 protein [Pseudomonadota bacterium]
MKIKTLHINTESTYRGGEQQVLYLTKGLNNQGHITHLVCQPDSGLHHHALQEGITTFPFRMRGEVDLGAAFSIARKIREENYDLIHIHTAHALSLVMGAFFFLKNKPVRVLSRRVQFSIFRHNFLGMNRYKYEKGVDHIIAISHKVKEMLVKDGIPPGMVSIVHSGVDVDRYRGLNGDYIRRGFSLPSHVPILGNVGYLEENKGQAYLIRAMAEVVKEYPEIRLFILGEGRLESELKALVKELRLERNIIFPGYRKDVGAFLKIFNLMVVSSVEEGLNSSILDALALEIPVVATDAGGISEIIFSEETGILVPRASHEALASGIIRMLSNPEEAKIMARKGCQKVREQFSDRVMVKKNLAIYQRLLEERMDR